MGFFLFCFWGVFVGLGFLFFVFFNFIVVSLAEFLHGRSDTSAETGRKCLVQQLAGLHSAAV